MTTPDPYRDDRVALIEENKRLRAEVARLTGERRQRGARFAVAAAVLVTDAVAANVLPAMINARDDARVGGGALLVVLLVAAHVWLALRFFPRGGSIES